jgi:hypothetical protein
MQDYLTHTCGVLLPGYYFLGTTSGHLENRRSHAEMARNRLPPRDRESHAHPLIRSSGAFERLVYLLFSCEGKPFVLGEPMLFMLTK